MQPSSEASSGGTLLWREEIEVQKGSNLAKVTEHILRGGIPGSGVLGSGLELITSEPSCLARKKGLGRWLAAPELN